MYEDPMGKEYGPHEMPDGWDGDSTADCIHGCGYSCGPSRSGGAFPGDNLVGYPCPNNPVNGQKLGGDRDKIAVLAQAAARYAEKARSHEHLLKEANNRLGEGAIQMAGHRDKLLKEGQRINHLLDDLRMTRVDLTPPDESS